MVWYPGGSREGGKGGCRVKTTTRGGEVKYVLGSKGTRVQVLDMTAGK